MLCVCVWLYLIDVCFLFICLRQRSQIQMTGVCLFVCVVGPGFYSTSPTFARSRASQAAGSDGRLAQKRNRAPYLGEGIVETQFVQMSAAVHPRADCIFLDHQQLIIIMSLNHCFNCSTHRFAVSLNFRRSSVLRGEHCSMCGSKRHSLQAVELSQRTQAAVQIVSNLPAPSNGGPNLPFFGHAGNADPLALLLTKAGDVETNPGPTTLNKNVWICDICHKQIHVRKQISIRCNRIEHWVHLRCAGIRQAQYTDTWTCHLHR